MVQSQGANTQGSSQSGTQALPQDKFLLVAANLLHRAFVEAPRTEAKQIFRALSEGKAVRLNALELEDKSIAQFGVALDHSEFKGNLNYGAFRASVGTLLTNLGAAIKEERKLTTFGDADSGGTQIFGVTAVTVEENKPNVMVLGAKTENTGGATILQLLYLDPSQFAGEVPSEITAADTDNTTA